MKTTLAQIRSFDPCQDRWKYLLDHLDPRPDDAERFPVLRVLDVNGVDDTLWLLGELGEQQPLVRFVCDCAERAVERYWEPRYPEDRRPQEAIEAARRWVDDPTEENRRKARAAEKAAAHYAALAAYYAAYYAAVEAALAAVEDPAEAAAAAVAAAHAARIAAADPAKEREWQIEHLRKILENDEG